jgi:cytoskeletal protein RodZ
VSIGDALAEARHQAGLTVTQVSQRTCIRETIIRGIEHDDYSACGGDFYARGHIRSIARAAGIDPEPLITEYDAVQPAPQSMTAADVFEPSRPIKLRERRRLNWSVALALVLLAVLGFGIYHIVTDAHAAPAAAQHHARPARQTARHPAGQPAHAAHQHRRRVIIDLTAAYDCWVSLTTADGKTIFSGIVYAGTAKRWTEHQPVQLELGNPAAVTLTVNGKSQVLANSTSRPTTLSLGPGRRAAR